MSGRHISRRSFARRALGSTASIALRPAALGVGANVEPSRLAIPGPFRGRVVKVSHFASINPANGIYESSIVSQMFERGLRELTGAAGAPEAWRMFFEPNDVVGLKVNPASAPYVISAPEVLAEIIRGLESAGVRRQNMIVYDRYRLEFFSAGMNKWVPEGVRTMFAAEEWDDYQQDLRNYDPEQYVELPFGMPNQDPSEPLVRRSHASLFLSREISKLVNLCTLKDHQAAGVTLALKSMSHGLFNNVNRTHPDRARNYTDAYIPAAVNHPLVRNKAVLHILDGVTGLYHSGPHAKPQFLWNHHSMYFASDPVALDRVGWDVLDRQRARAGMAPLRQALPDEYSIFYERHPEHVEIAGSMGLGEANLARIDLRTIRLDGAANRSGAGSEGPISLPPRGGRRR